VQAVRFECRESSCWFWRKELFLVETMWLQKL
jgi:hypothetical protein